MVQKKLSLNGDNITKYIIQGYKSQVTLNLCLCIRYATFSLEEPYGIYIYPIILGIWHTNKACPQRYHGNHLQKNFLFYSCSCAQIFVLLGRMLKLSSSTYLWEDRWVHQKINLRFEAYLSYTNENNNKELRVCFFSLATVSTNWLSKWCVQGPPLTFSLAHTFVDFSIGRTRLRCNICGGQ